MPATVRNDIQPWPILDKTPGCNLICEHQPVQNRLFDMFTKVETSLALSWAA